MQAAMVVTWREPVPGRELKAIEYGADVMEYWRGQANAGRCSEPELFFSEAGIGLWVVKGDRETLLAIHDGEESQNLIMRGQLLLAEFRVEFYTAGAESDAFMARFATMVGALA